MENNITTTPPASGKKKMILIGLGTTVTGLLGYFGWKWWQKRKEKKQEEEGNTSDNSDASSSAATLPASSGYSSKRNDDFPLIKGSKGEKVRSLQQALISKYGKSILPKAGADGDFGNEMLAALKKLNLPESVDESTYNVLVKGNAISAKDVAMKLYKAAASKNLDQVLFTLRGMKNTDDYAAVNAVFKNYLFGLVRKTLVNGLLDAFPDDNQKQQVRLEFIRMGLRFDGKVWSLAGIEPTEIITLHPTTVWDKSGLEHSVKENTVLGWALGSKKGAVCFVTKEGRTMGVHAGDVRQYVPVIEGLSGASKLHEKDWVVAAKQALVFNSGNGICIVPQGMLLGKLKFIIHGMAYIDTGASELMVKNEYIKKSKTK